MDEKEMFLELKTLKEADARLRTAQKRMRNERRNIGKQIRRLEGRLLKMNTDEVERQMKDLCMNYLGDG